MGSRKVLNGRIVCSEVTAILGVAVFSFLGGTAALAQEPASAPPAQGAIADTAGQNKQLTDQITELRAQVAKLQAAVQKTGPGKKVSSKSSMKVSSSSDKGMGIDDKSEMGMPPSKSGMGAGSPPMGMKDDQGEMGKMTPGVSMEDDKDEMSGMPMGSKTNASPAPDPSMGMCCMGKMASGRKAGMSGMKPAANRMALVNASSSATPGHAGVSHLYHIGSNGFFLNHSQHITLTPNQKFTLTNLKKKAMLERDSAQRNIEEGEEEVYTLTSADLPDHDKIQAEVVEIEKMRVDQRMNFIRAVADASNVLTPEQRKALLGTMVAARR